MSVRIPFAKGQGTHNDFIIIPDLEAQIDLSEERVRWLCNRRSGIGADGVLRIVKTEADPELGALCGSARYFMDYRNADGSVAEMCGNGVRVFARYLMAKGWESRDDFVVGTRAGCVRLTSAPGGDIAVHLPGPAVPVAEGFQVAVGRSSWAGVGVTLPNPHVVVRVDDIAGLGDLVESPRVVPSPAAGINVEFVQRKGPGHIAMRVVERGIGETQSCGTGACAAAWASHRDEPFPTWQVDVPGGRLQVEVHDDGSFTLTGPAVVIAEGDVTLP